MEINIEGLTDAQNKSVEALVNESVQEALKRYTEVDANRVVPLSEYRQGDKVEVLAISQGKWVPGGISEIGSWGISVDTERGPVTVGTDTRIRRA